MRPYELLRRPMRAWYTRILIEEAQLPRPIDEPSAVRGGAAAPIRVLLLGNGPCRGFGVLTHQLALTGQLALEIDRRTDAGCRVDYVGDDRMTVGTASSWLGDRGRQGYHAVLVVLGISDAATLTPIPLWERSLRELMDQLRDELGPEAHVFVASIPELNKVPLLHGLFGKVSQLHATKLNAATLRVIADTPSCHSLAVPTPRFELGRPTGSSQVYERLAEALAAQITPHVTQADPEGVPGSEKQREGQP